MQVTLTNIDMSLADDWSVAIHALSDGYWYNSFASAGEIRFVVREGGVYYLVIDARNGATGGLSLSTAPVNLG